MDKTIRIYFENLTPIQRKIMKFIRKIAIKYISETISEKNSEKISEKISYSMPSICLNGKSIFYYGAFKKHFNFFPVQFKFDETCIPTEKTIQEIIDKNLKKLKILNSKQH